jgi:hypothetical protein
MLIDARSKVVPELVAYESSTTGPVLTDVVDTQGLVGVAFHVDVAGNGITSITTTLETSDDNAAWSPATFDEVVGDKDGDLSVILTEAGKARISYSGLHQYVRATVTIDASANQAVTVISTGISQFSKEGIPIPGNE